MQVIRKHTMKNIQTGQGAAIYHDLEWNEWRVKFYAAGAHLVDADYHAIDEYDALETAGAYCGIGTDQPKH